MTHPSQNLKAGLIFSAIIVALFGGLVAMISGFVWLDFVVADARNAEACRTAWDSRFQPQYVASRCSIMQRGYRVPAPEGYQHNLSNIRSPEAGDY